MSDEKIDDNSQETDSATLREILDGEVPTFIAQRSHFYSNRIPEVFAELESRHGATLGLGTSIPLAHMKSADATSYMGVHSNLPLRIVDPELHFAPNSDWPEAGELKPTMAKWAYLREIPAKANTLWVRSVLKAQEDHGATVPLSASGWVSDSKPQTSLNRAMSFVRESRSEVGDDAPMFVNLAFSARWLSEAELRDMLLQEILESQEQLWHLRFYWPAMRGGRPQLMDPALLNGYREIVQTLADENRKLFLPNSGLTGWLSTALGAAGFTVGASWNDQKFAQTAIFRRRQGEKAPAAIPRLFDSALLHTMEHAEYQRLDELDGHDPIATAFADEILQDGHTKELASLHFLASVGHLQAGLSKKSPRKAALKRVRLAQEFIDGLPGVQQPVGSNLPAHLPLWRSMLS
jgi:hypothetical protein